MSKRILIIGLSIIALIMLMMVSCQSQKTLQGYVEGRYAYMAPNFSGVLTSLFVSRGDHVVVGQPLYVLEQQPESDIEKQSEAQKEQTIAQLELAKLTLKRYQELVRKNAIDQNAVDTAQSNVNALTAQLASTNAMLTQARWSSSKKIVNSSQVAEVFDTYYMVGEYVQAGKPVLSLLPPNQIKFIFFIPEPQLSEIKLNEEVKITCDGCKKESKAKISFISPQAEYTSPLVYSNESRGKLVYRVEAIPAEDPAQFHPGQPVLVSVKH
ncbi:MAG: HlyD family efflux transporter periplasmic adaptor subunit [Proteobacteria bacterium]|nr:HlyD family efflux transporter periplasmic adaptor subunit [Pseudomonadota bacterium]